MEYFQYIITAITAITALIVALRKVIVFFKEITPSSIKLQQYIIYKEKYSKYYSEKIIKHIDSEIETLSLAKLTKIQCKEKQSIYFDIICRYKGKVNDPLLRKLIQIAYVEEKSIDIFKSDLEDFYKRTFQIYTVGWYVGISVYLLANIIFFGSLYFQYTIAKLSLFKVSSTYIPVFLLYGAFWAFIIVKAKPINKNDLATCLKLLKKTKRLNLI
jgi:hypothetical protein